VAALLLLFLAAAACGPGEGPEAEPEADQEPPNILLISLDTLRADRVSGAGYHRETTPFLDALARRGTSFPEAFINTLGTTPSHTTMFSSLYQETHKVEYHHLEGQTAFDVIPGSVKLLAEVFKDAGYVTLGVHGGGRMSPRFGFDRGFDAYEAKGTLKRQIRRLLALVEQPREDGRPIFALFHTYEVHAPYRPPQHHLEGFGPAPGRYEPSIENLQRFKRTARRELAPEDLARFVDAYDAGIRYTDEGMIELFARLRRSGFLDNCLVVITADHGEEFAEHGGLLHRVLLYEELIRVPLVLFGPDVPEGVVDRRMAMLVDIAPTILAYAGIEVPPEMEGIDLLAPAPPERVGPDAAIVAQAGNVRYTLRTRKWKLIRTHRPDRIRLFDLENDPAERRNLKNKEPRVRDRMLETLEQWKRERRVLPDERRKAEMTAEELQMLEALGYVYDTSEEAAGGR